MAQVTLSIAGGDKLKARLAQIGASLSTGTQLRVGFLEGSTYPARARVSAKSKRKAARKAMYVAQVAFWNEFGTSRAPPRPFFRNTIAAKSPAWGDDLAKIATETDYNGARTLGVMGQLIKDQITQAIVDWPADNAPSTVQRKGFDKGLVDTGQMSRSVDFEVTK